MRKAILLRQGRLSHFWSSGAAQDRRASNASPAVQRLLLGGSSLGFGSLLGGNCFGFFLGGERLGIIRHVLPPNRLNLHRSDSLRARILHQPLRQHRLDIPPLPLVRIAS